MILNNFLHLSSYPLGTNCLGNWFGKIETVVFLSGAIESVVVMTDFIKIAEFLDQLLGDTSVPRNVRAAIAKAKEKLQGSEAPNVRASSAIYALDEVSNDINLPMHARTMIWNILSELEAMKSQE